MGWYELTTTAVDAPLALPGGKVGLSNTDLAVTKLADLATGGARGSESEATGGVG